MTLITHEEKHYATLLILEDLCNLSINQHHVNAYYSNYVFKNSVIEATKAITSTPFNLIIIDQTLNYLDLICAKETSIINSSTPILALITSEDIVQKQMLINSGFDDCIIKPLTSTSLSEIINFWGGNINQDSVHYSIELFLSHCSYNYDLALKLYSKLFDELPLLVNTIKTAIQQHEYEIAINTTHKLLGLAKVCYLKLIEETALYLEKNLIEKKYNNSHSDLSLLEQKTDDIINQRKQIVNYLTDRPHKT